MAELKALIAKGELIATGNAWRDLQPEDKILVIGGTEQQYIAGLNYLGALGRGETPAEKSDVIFMTVRELAATMRAERA